MKYHQKLNLRSPIYKYSNGIQKSKSPSKSPLKQSINPSDLFQKVCCPNCKYSFKIIKNQTNINDIKQTKQSTPSKIKINKKQQKQTQTQGILTENNRNSPININNKHMSPYSKISMDSSRNSQFTKRNSDMENFVQTGLLKVPDFKFNHTTISPRSNRTSSHLLQTLGTGKSPRHNMSKSPRSPISTQNNFSLIKKTSKQVVIQIKHQPQQKQRKLAQQRQYTPKKLTQKLQQPAIEQKKTQITQASQHVNIFVRSKSSIGTQYQIKQKQKPLQKQTQLCRCGGIKQQQITNKIVQQVKDKVVQPIKHNPVKSNINIQKSPNTNIQKNANINIERFAKDLFYKNQQNQTIIKHLRQFCKDIYMEVEMPSYCKMIALSHQNL